MARHGALEADGAERVGRAFGRADDGEASPGENLRAHPRGGRWHGKVLSPATGSRGMPLCRELGEATTLTMAETETRAAGRASVTRAPASSAPRNGGGASRHADDRPISGDQGGQCRLPAVLPHGRFLRAVLRGRRDRLARARHRAHQARQASRRGHPDVRRAGPCRRRLSPAPDRGRATGSRCASRSRTRPRPRSAGPRPWCAATWCASSRPGTLTEETLLDARAHNFLTALFRAPAKEGGEPRYALASLDISTGELIASSVGAERSCRRACAAQARRGAGRRRSRRRCRAAPPDRGSGRRAHAVPARAFRFATRRASAEERVSAWPRSMPSASSREPSLPRSPGCSLMSRSPRSARRRCSARRARRRAGSLLIIDAATRANLELIRSNQGARAGSLLAAIDRTVTAAGARELASRLGSPLTDAGGGECAARCGRLSRRRAAARGTICARR